VVYPVRDGMMLYREDQFGPIVPVMSFEELETALEYVITSENGQQVSIFSQDPDRIGKLADPLVNQVCRVNINCQYQRGPDVFPFTVRKDSAEGTLSVKDAALVLDPVDGRGQADRGQQAFARRHRERPQVELHKHAVHLLTAVPTEDQGGARGP
jgi:aldehyde dehydrogenase family protein